MTQVNAKRIAKNTIYMYIRQIVVMVVTLYTARVILDKLGATDYGIFNAVAGVVGLLSFINNTLAKGTSRFLTFELGRNDVKKLAETYSTSFFSHIVLAIGVVLVLEIVGPWFISNKLIIPEIRMNAALWCFQISLIQSFIGIVMVPFTATIIAHEDMGIYAYVGLIEAASKLLIAFLISRTSYDKLIIYSLLLLIVQFLIIVFYFIYCRKQYSETRRLLVFNKKILYEMLGFSGWNLLTHFAVTLQVQGRNILIGMFFEPVIVAAQAIANQVTTALMNFVYNFTTAINPQIIKSFAEKDYESSKKLTLESTVFVFDLVLLICLPFCFTIDTILGLWLVNVPIYAAKFCKFILISQIVGVFNITFYTPMIASGKLKTNSILAIIMEVVKFVILYALFKYGFGVMWLMYISLASTSIWAFFIKPYILRSEIGYEWKRLASCYVSCGKVFAPSLIMSIVLNRLFNDGLINQIILFVSVAFVVIVWSIVFMDASFKRKMISFLFKQQSL